MSNNNKQQNVFQHVYINMIRSSYSNLSYKEFIYIICVVDSASTYK